MDDLSKSDKFAKPTAISPAVGCKKLSFHREVVIEIVSHFHQVAFLKLTPGHKLSPFSMEVMDVWETVVT